MTHAEAREIKRMYKEGNSLDFILAMMVKAYNKELCKICGKSFTKVGNSLCCSDECRLENKRQNRRRSWHRVGKYKDDKYARHIKQKMRRIRSDRQSNINIHE